MNYNIVELINNLISYINLKCENIQIITIIFLLISGIVFLFYEDKKFFKYELVRDLKIVLMLIGTSSVISKLEIKGVENIRIAIFGKYMAIIYIIIHIVYLLEIFFYWKSVKKFHYLNYINNIKMITYAFIALSKITYLNITFILAIYILDLSLIKCGMQEKTMFQKVKAYSLKWKKFFQSENTEYGCEELEILYPCREDNLKKIKDFIIKTNDTSYSIAINSEWGSGKSILIKNLINQLIDDSNYVIYIRPLINDTKEALLKDFKSQVENIMVKNGIYSTGINSLDSYCKEVLDILSLNSKVTLKNIISFNNKEMSFKESQEALQEDIDNLLNNSRNKDEVFEKKIVIVVDDFDRVEDANQKEVLSFIKEIVDFKGCITLIALDYKNLRSNNIVTREYLEKFIDNTIELAQVEFNEIMNFHFEKRLFNRVIKVLRMKSGTDEIIEKIISELNMNKIQYYYDFKIRLENEINKLKNDIDEVKNNSDASKVSEDSIKNMEEEYNSLKVFYEEKDKYINNSRRNIHFIDEIGYLLIGINNIILDAKKSEKKLYEILKNMDIARILYVFAYIKIFCNEDFDKLLKSYSLQEWLEDMVIDNVKYKNKYYNTLLYEILEDSSLLEEPLSTEKFRLLQENSLRFIINVVIKGRFDLSYFEFYTKSEKKLNIIDNNESIEIISNYEEEINEYRRIIKENMDNNDLNEKRHKKLAKCICELYNDGKIYGYVLLSSVYRNNKILLTDYSHCYINCLLEELSDSSLKKIIMEKGLIKYANSLDELVSQYAACINCLMEINCLRNKIKIRENDRFIKENFIKTYEYIEKFSLDNKLINNNFSKDDGFEKLIRSLEFNISDTYKGIRHSILHEKIDGLIKNYNSMKKLRNEIDHRSGEVDSGINLISNYKQACETLNGFKSKTNIYNSNQLKCIDRSLARIKEEYEKENREVEETLLEEINIVLENINTKKLEERNIDKVMRMMVDAEKVYRIGTK
jgi:hypothetical protein